MLMMDGAKVSLCTLRVGDEVFGIDTQKVHEVLGERVIHAVALAPEFVGGVIPYRGEVLLVVSFRSLLGMEALGGPVNVMVLRDEQEGELFGVAVDAVEDVLMVDAATLEENPCTLDARRKAFRAGIVRV